MQRTFIPWVLKAKQARLNGSCFEMLVKLVVILTVATVAKKILLAVPER